MFTFAHPYRRYCHVYFMDLACRPVLTNDGHAFADSDVAGDSIQA